MDRLERILESVLGKDSARMSVVFMMSVDIIREIEISSLINRVIHSVLEALSSVVGVEMLKDGERIASVGNKDNEIRDFPLTEGYTLRVHSKRLDDETLEVLRYVQALLSYHMYNIIRLEKIKEMAVKDRLTGAYTRSAGEELLEKYSAMARRGKDITLVFVDLDGLKEINDNLGHEAGDEYLRSFVEAFESSTRTEDVVIRWGGDEFVLVFPGADPSDAEGIISRISSIFEGDFSWGWCHMPEEAEDVETALEKADSRMYRMKKFKKSRRSTS